MKSFRNALTCFTALMMVVVMSFSAFAATDIPDYTDAFYVNDYAEVISQETEERICALGYDLASATGAELVVVTTDFLGGMDIEDYANKMFDEWQLGDPEKNNGVLLLMVIAEENYWVMQGKGLEDKLSSGKLGTILEEYLEPDFASEDYDSGALKIYEKLTSELCQIYGVTVGTDGSMISPETEPVPEPVVEKETFPIGAVILIIVVIIALIMLIVFIERVNNPRPKRFRQGFPPVGSLPQSRHVTRTDNDIDIFLGGLGTGRGYGGTRRRSFRTFTSTSSRRTGGFGGSSGRSSFGSSRGGRIGGGGRSRGGGAGRR